VRRTAAPRALLLLVIGGASVAVARADVVHLKEGGTLEGKVVAEDATTVTLDTRFGRQVLERSRIERIEKKPTAEEEIAEREAKLKPGTPDEWFALAEFAGKKGLKKERERLLDKVLALDPDHEGANVARGRVRYEGKWMTPAERDAKVKSADDAAKRAQGLVEFEGRWVTPQEKEHLERGDVLWNGKWMSPDQAKTAQGLVKLGDTWIPAAEAAARARIDGFKSEAKVELGVEAGGHVVVASALGEAHGKALRDASEKAFTFAATVMGDPDDVTWIGGQKALAIVVATRDDFDRFVHFFAAHEPKVDKRWADGVSRADGFYWWDPIGTSATYKGPRSADETVSQTIHNLGHVLLNRHQYNFKYLPTWLDEGFAILTEYEVLGRNFTCCIAPDKYATGTGRKDDLLPNQQWYDEAVKAIVEKSDPPLVQIVRRDLATISRDEVKKSMVVVKWLCDERRDGLRKLMAALRKSWPKGAASAVTKEAIDAQTAAFAALGMPPEQVDAEVRRYATSLKAPKSDKAGGPGGPGGKN
jgi:hypothetical protein